MATQRLREYIVKGVVLDDERLRNPDRPFDYFEEMLAKLRTDYVHEQQERYRTHHLADMNIMMDLDDGVKKNHETLVDVLANILG